MQPGVAYWLEEAPPAPPAPALTRETDADVAIVGGGYTGLWTALALRARAPGLRVVLLEAGRCGTGPSGLNGGFLHGYWSRLPLLRERLGDEAALRLARASEGSVIAVRALGDDVGLVEGGLLKVSAAPAQDAALDALVRAADELGVPEEAVALTRDEVAARCASPVFRRGVLVRHGATVQPARLARALRRRVEEAGVEIHECSPVRTARGGLVRTDGGSVRAPEVVVAVNAWAARWRPLARRLTAFGSACVVTEPVPALLEELRWTGGEAIVDGRMFVHYFRTTGDGRVLMGSGGGEIARGGRIDDRLFAGPAAIGRAETGLRALLPSLSEVRVTHGWGGPIDVSSDQLPFVGTLAERGTAARIHYAAGYSGSGVGPSWLAAQALASLVVRADDAWARLPLVRPLPRALPPEPAKGAGGAVVRRALLAVEDAEQAGRRPRAADRAVAGLPRLLGVPLGRR
ncbi:MAG TPA: FAD-binding oxidoreductase [Gaiellaceae bacterium]|nr:FAD-binding oxidoreductase [Gaiellaceae bacterium]